MRTRSWIGLGLAWILAAGAAGVGARAQDAREKSNNVARRLAAMDKDGDGRITREEFDGPARIWERLDADRDGVVTRDEVRAMATANPAEAKAKTRANPAADRDAKPSVGFVPLDDLGAGLYRGKPGGLYPDGARTRPEAHERAGLDLARAVRPLDREGRPADDGKIVLISIGMSNTTQEFSAFQALAKTESGLNPRLVLVDGAVGGMDSVKVADPEAAPGRQYWNTVEARLKQAGVTAEQVQVAWIKEAIARPSADFPADAEALERDLATIVHLARETFPNLRLAYLSSRIYGGYADGALNPEPYAYQSGFAVKWLIARQIEGMSDLNFDPSRGPVKSPWLSWGPYLWADGTSPRADGLTYDRSDLGPDGTHPSPEGRKKVARQLLTFFRSDSTARPWFLAESAGDGGR